MSGGKRRPGDPYEVGYGSPPKQTRFEKGVSGNPNGRPRKKPDLYAELTAVLKEKVTVTIEGEPRRVTVQQALLLRLRDEALHGQIWAGKLVQKVIDAVPDRVNEHDRFDVDVRVYRAKALLRLALVDAQREEAGRTPESPETGNDG